MDIALEWTPSRGLRSELVIAAVGTYSGISALFGSYVVGAAGKALSLMLLLLVPWSAVNLVDYFVVRRGNYISPDLFTAHGIYGSWR
ncbi:purine-cytosine permease-like protein [Rhodococcus sp. 27YEA15]|uniref:hypothetical protein n=1 Tax=Rhodococcus sp. 27YEA15 TaxID=3156259 RepID=UPI003C7B1731